MGEAERTRRCGDCGQVLMLEKFAFKSRSLGTVQSRCRTCQSVRAREHYQKHAAGYRKRAAANTARLRLRNREGIRAYLAEQRCADCGLHDFVVFEFDHRDPTTKRTDISTLVHAAAAWVTIMAEIEKCDVVCANCHRRRTARQFGWHKLGQPRLVPLPLLPRRGTAEYERVKSRRGALSRRHRNRLLVWEYLQSHPCAICGVADPIVLEFDHLKDKQRDIGWLIPASGVARILEEIGKCRVLCANCHRRHTARQAGWFD